MSPSLMATLQALKMKAELCETNFENHHMSKPIIGIIMGSSQI